MTPAAAPPVSPPNSLVSGSARDDDTVAFTAAGRAVEAAAGETVVVPPVSPVVVPTGNSARGSSRSVRLPHPDEDNWRQDHPYSPRVTEREYQNAKRSLQSLNKWDRYTQAKEAMFLYTDIADAPWTVVKSNDKKRARIEAIRYVLHVLDYTDKDPDVVDTPDPLIVGIGPAARMYEEGEEPGGLFPQV